MKWLFSGGMIALAVSVLSCSCSVILKRDNRENRVELSENEKIGIRKIKGRHRNLVLLASEDNLNTYASAGGNELFSKLEFLNPYFVSGSRGGYVRLYEYAQSKLFERRTNDRSGLRGWVKADRLIDLDAVRAMGKHNMLSVRDTFVLSNPERFFVNCDSLWLFSDTKLTKRCGAVSLYKPVYVIKRDKEHGAALVAESAMLPFPYADIHNRGKWISNVAIGWVSERFLSVVRGQFDKIAVRDSANIIIPWGRSGRLSLIDIGKIGYDRLNFILFFPNSNCLVNNKAEIIKICREAEISLKKSSLQSLKGLEINYLGVCESDSKNCNVITFTPDTVQFFKDINMYLWGTGNSAPLANPLSVYDKLNTLRTVMGRYPSVFGANAVNLVINIGSRASADIVCNKSKLLEGYDYRLLSYQLGRETGSLGHNFVLQSSDIIRHYSNDYLKKVRSNRLFYLAKGGDSLLVDEVKVREVNPNFYMLDVPANSVVEGGVVFSTPDAPISGGAMETALDTVLGQMYAFFRRHERIVDNAFRMTGFYDECYSAKFMKAMNFKDVESVRFPYASRNFFGREQLYFVRPLF